MTRPPRSIDLPGASHEAPIPAAERCRTRKKDIFECNCKRVYTRAFRIDAEC